MRAKLKAVCMNCREGFNMIHGDGMAKLHRRIMSHFRRKHPGRRCVSAQFIGEAAMHANREVFESKRGNHAG